MCKEFQINLLNTRHQKTAAVSLLSCLIHCHIAYVARTFPVGLSFPQLPGVPLERMRISGGTRGPVDSFPPRQPETTVRPIEITPIPTSADSCNYSCVNNGPQTVHAGSTQVPRMGDFFSDLFDAFTTLKRQICLCDHFGAI